MAYLFEVTSKRTVYPIVEILLVSPFKEIWKRDKSVNKEQALSEFAYIEFTTSMLKTNPYRQYPEKRKAEIIRNAVIGDLDWEPDPLMLEAISKIEEFQKYASTTYTYYLAAKIAAEHMQEFFKAVDLNKLNENTKNPLYKPRDLTSALNDTEKVLANLKALERKVEEELYDEMKTKSNKVISFFADPESLKKRV